MIRLVLGCCLACLPSAAIANEPESVRPAAYASLNLPERAQQVQFSKRPTREGDRVGHHVQARLEFHSTVRQAGQVVKESTTSIEREQQRDMIVDHVADGRTVGVRVRFRRSQQTTDDQPAEPQPIVGRTYRCRRLEDDTLQVTRADGSLPAPEEFELVSTAMASLGRPNPLADFLAGKTVEVGQSLEVPDEVGAALLNADEQLGSVSRFVLTLREVVEQSGAEIARFDAEIETQGSHQTQMRLIVTGTLDVEPTTCRTRRLQVTGPLGMATTQGSYSAPQTTLVRGKMHLVVEANYADR